MASLPRVIFEFGPFQLDPNEHRLRRGGDVVPLTPKAFDTLRVLVARAGELVSRQELFSEVWPNTHVEDGVLAKNISDLRKALDHRDADQYIETVPKRGYRFVALVRVIPVAIPGAAPLAGMPAGAPAASVGLRPRGLFLPVGAQDTVPPSGPPLEMPPEVLAPPGRSATRIAILTVAGLAVVAGVLLVRGRIDTAASLGPRPSVASLAVLPFQHTTPGAGGADDYLASAMADGLIARLAAVRTVTIRPVTAVMQYAAAPPEPGTAGRELRVEAVVHGTFEREGDRIRITAHLTRVADNGVLWTERVEAPFSDLFRLQDAIAKGVSSTLAPSADGSAAPAVGRRSPNPLAYEAYLRGRHYWNKRTPDALEQARGFFAQALDHDAAYGPAYAGLADCYALLGAFGALRPDDAFPRARAAAMRAIEIDDTLAEAHTSLAFSRFAYDWDWAGAEQAYRRAIDLNPNYATAHHWFAILLMVVGRADESLAEIRRAEEIDPLSQAIGGEILTLLVQARRYDDAIEHSHRLQRLSPGSRGLDWSDGEALLEKGLVQEALDRFDRRYKAIGARFACRMAYAYGRAGDTARAREMLRIHERSAEDSAWKAWERAMCHVGIGEHEKAIDDLEEAYRLRHIGMTWLKVGPGYDALRSNPRFQDLLRRMKLS